MRTRAVAPSRAGSSRAGSSAAGSSGAGAVCMSGCSHPEPGPRGRTGKPGERVRSLQQRSGAEDGAGAGDVAVDGGDERVHVVVALLAPQPRDEVDAHLVAVEVLVDVEDVGLDGAHGAGECRVRAD